MKFKRGNHEGEIQRELGDIIPGKWEEVESTESYFIDGVQVSEEHFERFIQHGDIPNFVLEENGDL